MCQVFDVVLFLIPKKNSSQVLHHYFIWWEEWHSGKLRNLLNLVPDVQYFTLVTLAESLFYWLCPQLDNMPTNKKTQKTKKKPQNFQNKNKQTKKT